MVFSYSGDPSSSLLDRNRFHTGDTDETDPQLGDFEHWYLVNLYTGGNEFFIAARTCASIAAKLSRQVTRKVDNVEVDNNVLTQHYRQLEKSLMARVPATPYCGGISQTDKQTQEQNMDRVTPPFSRDWRDMPDAATIQQGPPLPVVLGGT